MLTSTLRIIVVALLTLLASSLIVFMATNVLPGDTAQAILGNQATPEMLEAMRLRLGLDQPLFLRYFAWLGGFLTGDMGQSLATQNDVWSIVRPRLINTLVLAGYAAVIGIPLGLYLGIASAARAEGPLDRSISIVSVVLVSMPEFVVALILAMVFAVTWKLFPSTVTRIDWGQPTHILWQLFLPMLTLLALILAHIVKLTRASLLDIMATPYIEFALLKGVPKHRILLRHALPNAIGPILSVIALTLGYLISGVALVEVVFSYPGLGRLMIDSILYRDFPLIQACTLIFCALYILLNTVSDLSGAYFNTTSPRVN